VAIGRADGGIYLQITQVRGELRSSRRSRNCVLQEARIVGFLLDHDSPNRAKDKAKAFDVLIHPTIHCVSEYGNVAECICGDGILSAGPVHSSTC